MNVYEIIDKKKRGLELNQTEIEYLINGYVNNEIPDYQISAWLMAVYFQGMTDRELLALTNCMTKSGEIVDLSSIMGVKVDKHSTGGVGDKVTLVVAPIVAVCGGKVAKMSGRGLGFTGGTIDKLEAIPGLKTALAEEDFFNMVNEIGLAVMGQSADIAPADKKLYALRDVTATVDSIPLIASSIMSKKLAAGSDKIVLDVTVGSGAFMKDKENAVQLAEKMVAIGNGAGKKTVAILTNMDVPLGKMVGNNLEVVEAIETLKGRGPEDLIAVVVEIASTMLYLAQIGTKEECMKKVKRVIADGSALEKLKLEKEKRLADLKKEYDKSFQTFEAYSEELNIKKDLLNTVKDKLSAVDRLTANKLADNNELLAVKAELLTQEYELEQNIINISSKIEEMKIITGMDI